MAALELHWRITLRNRAHRIPMDELWQRSTTVSINGGTVQGFCPEDLRLHVCTHATYFANRYPRARIIALEPEEANFALLRQNVAPTPQAC